MDRQASPGTSETSLRERLYVVIFEHDTEAGRLFDVVLLWAVLLSVLAVILESVESVRSAYGGLLRLAEWILTAVFTLEYLLRIYAARRRLAYVLSFFGLIDLVAVLPTFAGVFFPAAHSLLVVRVLRLLRIFRVLKLASFHGEGDALLLALRASMPKITVFLGAVLSVVVIVGSAMYVIEGVEGGFTSIPRSMYWAIVTLTTVGYGDIAPHTPLGQALASLLMVLGYGIIAVPTGIVSAEIVRSEQKEGATRCASCDVQEVRADARFCRACGAPLGRGGATQGPPPTPVGGSDGGSDGG